MLPTVIRRRRPMTAIAWLCIIYFEPILGSLIYWLVGGDYLPRKRIRLHEKVSDKMETVSLANKQEAHVCCPSVPAHYGDLPKLSQMMGNFPCVSGNKLDLIAESRLAIDRLISDIQNAKTHVHLLFYIFENDHTGHRVADALVDAAARGVTCRVLADTVGSWSMFNTLGEQMKAAGILVQPMLPVSPLRRRLARIDLRNHRKLAVIDGTVAYTGSQNIVGIDNHRDDQVWYDLMVRMEGPIVRQMQLVFIEDWYFETGERLEGDVLLPELNIAGDVVAQTVPTGPAGETESLEHLIVSSIHHAQRQVTITSPYLVPNSSFMSALEIALLRGVQIDIVVPAKSDHWLVSRACQSYYRDMMEIGVQLYLHQHGMLHSKTMTVDNTFALVGSGNFDIRSFRLNFELNLLLYGDTITKQVWDIQQLYIGQSKKLDYEHWKQRGQWTKFTEDVAKMLSPLM